jgi:hypothetical protein
MGAVQPQRELSNQLAVAVGQLLAQNGQSMNAPRGECSEHQPRKVEDAPGWVTKPRCHGTDMTVRVARVIRDAVALTCYLRMVLRWCYRLLYSHSLLILGSAASYTSAQYTWIMGSWPHHDRLDVRGDVEFQCSPYHSWFTLYSEGTICTRSSRLRPNRHRVELTLHLARS